MVEHSDDRFPVNKDNTLKNASLPKGTDLPFQIIQQGSVSYIASLDGMALSSIFHDISVYKFKKGGKDFCLLITELGSQKRLISIDLDPLQVKEAQQTFQELNYIPELKVVIGKEGSLKFIVSGHTGAKTHENGYHEIILKDGQYYGRTGSQTELIVFNDTFSQLEQTELP